MKFTVSSQELSTALQIVNMARKGKTPMQILECVLIEAQENKIVLTGTDMSMQVSYSIPCDVGECGKSAIRGTLIEEVVKKFPDGMLAVDVNEKDAFTVKSGRIKSRLSGNKSDEFPVKEPMDASKTVTIPANDFCDMIASTEMCIAVEDVRQVLNGGCLDVSSGAVSMVGMDGFRMAVRTIKPSSVPDDMRVIIPIKTLGVLKKMLSNAGDELIDLRFTDKDFGLSFGNAADPLQSATQRRIPPGGASERHLPIKAARQLALQKRPGTASEAFFVIRWPGRDRRPFASLVPKRIRLFREEKVVPGIFDLTGPK